MGRSQRVVPDASGPYNPARTPLAKILAIRAACAAGDQVKDVAAANGVSVQTVRRWRDRPEARLPKDDYIPGTTQLIRSARQGADQPKGPPEPKSEVARDQRPIHSAPAPDPFVAWPEDPKEAFAYWHCLPESTRGTRADFSARYGADYRKLKRWEQSKTWQDTRDKLNHELRGGQFVALRARRQEVLEALHEAALARNYKAIELWFKVVDDWIPKTRSEIEVAGPDPRVVELFDHLNEELANGPLSDNQAVPD